MATILTNETVAGQLPKAGTNDLEELTAKKEESITPAKLNTQQHHHQKFQQEQIPDQTNSTIERSTYKNLIVISIGFLFLFTAFTALQNLQSSIHTDAKLGLASLSVIYAFFTVSCMFVPPILISRLGAKYTVIVSMSGYVLYTLNPCFIHTGEP